jgi:hypothetical protein
MGEFGELVSLILATCTRVRTRKNYRPAGTNSLNSYNSPHQNKTFSLFFDFVKDYLLTKLLVLKRYLNVSI